MVDNIMVVGLHALMMSKERGGMVGGGGAKLALSEDSRKLVCRNL